MKRTILFFKTIIIMAVLAIPFKDVKAEIDLSDCLTLNGFVRYEFGIHTGHTHEDATAKYPAQALPDALVGTYNNNLTLSRFFLQTEWNYKPSDQFKLFANVRLIEDTTSLWDSSLHNYNAVPVDVPSDKDLMLRMGHTDHFRAEVWELYSDIKLGSLWLRLGKQQIAWGEMIGARILDCINPLDLSWNFSWEPEEYELIRIPEWTIRGIYNLSSILPGYITNGNIEAFLIPGDVQPNQLPEPFSPYFLYNPYFLAKQNIRGKLEYGVRVGAGIAGFYGTLNYLHLYDQNGVAGFDPIIYPSTNAFGLPFKLIYRATNNYGASLNYALPHPYNLVFTFEGLYTVNQPYNGNPFGTEGSDPRNMGTFKWAFRIDNNSWVWPKHFLAPSMTMFTLEFVQTAVQGNNLNIFGPSFCRIDKTQQMGVVQVQQPLLHGDLTPSIQFAYQTWDAHLIKPSITYHYGNHWYYDVFATVFGGGNNRPGSLENFYWGNSIFGRITYQF